jgi:Chlorite dismutase
VKPLPVTFVSGSEGQWRIDRLEPVIGAGLPDARRLAVIEGTPELRRTGSAWTLRGVTSNERYVEAAEQAALRVRQPRLGRRQATRAALIPITKSEAWWALAHDERRAIFEERSRHIATSLPYLPAVARRLHHGRDLGEPFDFLTWFEYAPSAADEFETLVQALRATEEWEYVEREVDIRLSRR